MKKWTILFLLAAASLAASGCAYSQPYAQRSYPITLPPGAVHGGDCCNS